MVGTELKLESIGCSRVRRGHDSCVVDQDVDLIVVFKNAPRERPDRSQIREVELRNFYVRRRMCGFDDLQRLRAFSGVAARDDHARPSSSQLARHDQTEAAVAASDDCRAACLIRHLFSGPFRSHARKNPFANANISRGLIKTCGIRAWICLV
jgi:hypothetical protein